jgi:hypothetical protein
MPPAAAASSLTCRTRSARLHSLLVRPGPRGLGAAAAGSSQQLSEQLLKPAAMPGAVPASHPAVVPVMAGGSSAGPAALQVRICAGGPCYTDAHAGG